MFSSVSVILGLLSPRGGIGTTLFAETPFGSFLSLGDYEKGVLFRERTEGGGVGEGKDKGVNARLR